MTLLPINSARSDSSLNEISLLKSQQEHKIPSTDFQSLNLSFALEKLPERKISVPACVC